MRPPQNMLLPIWLSSRKLSLSKFNVGSLQGAKGSLHLSNNALSNGVVDVTAGVVAMRHLIRSGMLASVDDSFDGFPRSRSSSQSPIPVACRETHMQRRNPKVTAPTPSVWASW